MSGEAEAILRTVLFDKVVDREDIKFHLEEEHQEAVPIQTLGSSSVRYVLGEKITSFFTDGIPETEWDLAIERKAQKISVRTSLTLDEARRVVKRAVERHEKGKTR